MQAELTEMMDNYHNEMVPVPAGVEFGETWQEPLAPLLADLSEQLTGMTEIVLSPHGQLHLLPWPALLQRACDRSAHDRLAVVIEPALSLFAMLTARSASESAASTGRPRNRTTPRVGRSRRPAMRSSVDLPLPFGPITVRISPSLTASAGTSSTIAPP